MRLHPVIPMVVRHLMEPATIGGIDLPRGVNIGPSILIGHAREDSHRDAGAFRPERFLDGEVATEHLDPVRWRRPPLHRRRLLADGGRRGAARGAGRYDVRLPEGTTDVPKVRNITSVPRHGARVVVG